jgi:hypothetical protein
MNACALATGYCSIGFGSSFHTVNVTLIAYSMGSFPARQFTANGTLTNTVALIFLALIDVWRGSLCLRYTCKRHQQ